VVVMINPKCLPTFVYADASPAPASKVGPSAKIDLAMYPEYKKYHTHNFILLRKTTYQTLLKTLPILRSRDNGMLRPMATLLTALLLRRLLAYQDAGRDSTIAGEYSNHGGGVFASGRKWALGAKKGIETALCQRKTEGGLEK
jgi:hypothetical protein